MDPNTPLQPYVPPPSAFGPQPAAQPPASPLPAPAPSSAVPLMQPLAMTPASAPAASTSLTPAVTPMSATPSFQPPSAPLDTVPVPGAPTSLTPRDEVTDKLRQANNVLVTVSNNPSVDQLSSAIGLTLLLNKLGKHATAVFSGKVPSTLEFLQPEKTIEKNTDSLRDFIIALDKAKADKLRYKVEDRFVKIFITPYHTSLSEDDLEFSQGDFNVDVVIAVGVHKKEELDEAITAHGRILHDAVVACVNNRQTAELGSINWYEPGASSLCEMVVGLIEPLQGNQTLLDEQIATAFLTGVVAETQRFSNDKTTPHTMNIAATLMKAGANQQLVASKLQEPMPITQTATNVNSPASTAKPTTSDGALEIEHKKEEEAPAAPSKTLDDLEKANNADSDGDATGDDTLDKIHIDDNGQLQRIAELEEKKKEEEEKAKKEAAPSSNMILEPPTLGGALSANTVPESSPPPVNPLTNAPSDDKSSSMQHGKSIKPLSEQTSEPDVEPVAVPAPDQKPEPQEPQTLSQIEQAVDSPHVGAADETPKGMGIPVAPAQPTPATPATASPSADTSTTIIPPDPGLPPDPTAGSPNPSAPPPVPPPLIPPDAE